MPLSAEEAALMAEIDYDHQRVDYVPQPRSKIGKWTIVAFVLNRTIGSGIFLTPHRVLAGVGCVGGALCLWALGSLLSICGLYVWLECGLSMPQQMISGHTEPRPVPSSGGEKNYLEFMFPNRRLRLPHIRTTCSFAIMFLLMYNLSGNLLSFGIQVLSASGRFDPTSGEVPERGAVIGIAVAAMTLIILLHSFSRGIALWINNIFAIVKVCLLLAIVVLGIAKAAGAFGGVGEVAANNFTQNVWTTSRTDLASWSTALTLCMYTFSGYEQPFYVLAETDNPRRNFPKYTVLAMIIAAVLFMLVNISYLLVVDKSKVLPATAEALPGTVDLATLFFYSLWPRDDQRSAARAMAAIIAVSIFGNLWVMTYTAARVKQELAKEGILPYSLDIGTAYKTPWGMLKQRLSRHDIPDEDVERAPTAAYGLHWLTSILLIAVTAAITDPRKAYSVLVSLYSYTIILLLGFWVAAGLSLTKLRKETFHWQQRRTYRPWLSPFHHIVFATATAYMMITTFLPPASNSPFSYAATGLQWYIVPTIGLSMPLWGVLWYWGLLVYEAYIKHRELVVTRQVYTVEDPDWLGEYLQVAEIIDHTWEVSVEGKQDS